eukprot:Nk52_evm10s1485 gene=Nk52_evmTU10s1485
MKNKITHEMKMGSVLLPGEPRNESNRFDKLCSYCFEPNKSGKKNKEQQVGDYESDELPMGVCAKCRCTPYCSQECQKKDWPDHKRWCRKNPIYDLADSLPFPSEERGELRPYTNEEKNNLNYFYIIRAGQNSRPPTDERDSILQQIIPGGKDKHIIDYSSLEEAVNGKSRGGSLNTSSEPEEMVMKVLGSHLDALKKERRWGGLGCKPVTGYSCVRAGDGGSDVAWYTYFHDNNSFDQQRWYSYEENILAPAVIGNFATTLRGDVIITKNRHRYFKVNSDEEVDEDEDEEDDSWMNEGVYEEEVPFPVTELVDLIMWRRHCGGKWGGHSARVWKENMRRAGFASALEEKGFVNLHL